MPKHAIYLSYLYLVELKYLNFLKKKYAYLLLNLNKRLKLFKFGYLSKNLKVLIDKKLLLYMLLIFSDNSDKIGNIGLTISGKMEMP